MSAYGKVNITPNVTIFGVVGLIVLLAGVGTLLQGTGGCDDALCRSCRSLLAGSK